MESHRSSHQTSRSARALPALAPGFIKVDERSEAELLAFAPEYARLLSYFNEKHEPVSDWTGFFKADVSFLLAQMCTVDARAEFFESLERQQRIEDEEARKRQILTDIVDAARRIDSWHERAAEAHRHAEDDGVEGSLIATLETVITEKLAGLLTQDATLKAEWEQEPRQHIWTTSAGMDAYDSRGMWESDPTSIYNEFNRATAQLAAVAREYLEQSLSEKSDHPPHTALFLTFVTLLTQAQAHLNTLTDRHLDFYYEKVLRLHPRKGDPDRAHLHMELAPRVDGLTLERGTLLDAGKADDEEDVFYATDEEIVLNRAAVVSLKALSLPGDPEVEGDGRGRNPAAGMYAFPIADSEDGRGSPLEHPEEGWPAFGRTAFRGAKDRADAPNAPVGLVFASPMLLLREGERRIEIDIRFASAPVSLGEALGEYRRGVQSKYEGDLSHGIFWQMLSRAFLVHYSTTDGYAEVASYVLESNDSRPDVITLIVNLGANDPPVVPNVDLVDEQDSEDPWPLIKIGLNPDARVYAYRFLENLVIESISLRVDVKGLETLVLRNDQGPVDASKPFALFGALPVSGSSFTFASDELCNKKLASVRLNLEWANLPRAPEDLASYYAGYDLGVTNESFLVSLSALSDFKWLPIRQAGPSAPDDDETSSSLFTSASSDGPGLLPRSVLDFDLQGMRLVTKPEQGETVANGNPSASGLFRLELADPPQGFGHRVYPRLLTEAVTANARPIRLGRRKPVPNPPFVPEVKKVSLDYSASTEIRPTRGANAEGKDDSRVYHLHPFAKLVRTSDGRSAVPVYEENGYLFLGIAGSSPPQSLSLLFHMQESMADKWCIGNAPDDGARPDTIRWRYLSNNQWRELKPNAVLSDGTQGFTRSGIVKIRLPRDMTDSSTVMGSGLRWLQIAVKRDPESYGRMIGVHTQAVTATRVCGSNDVVTVSSVPAGTISGLTEKLAGVQLVSQPYASASGRPAESTGEFRVRVSERLRHKERAIQSKDYECMVLERFPSIDEVKCFGVGAGKVVVVVTPVRAGGLAEWEPRVPEHTLRDIAEYLRQYTSPFVEELCVRNPWYEPLKVTAWMNLTSGDAGVLLRRLEQGLDNFLAPWRFDESTPMQIGTGCVDLPGLRAFLERQPNVRQVTGLSIVHVYKTEDGRREHHRLRDSARASGGQAIFRASTPWSVLIPARAHRIRILQERSGIGDLEIASDLVVTSRDDAEALAKRGLSYPRQPQRAGIGNLHIGADFIVTTGQEVIPEASLVASRDNHIGHRA
jgi:hypothetical protein